ncbi:9091_t:CDS:2, partial [Cetraspora pellucida]
AIGIGHHSYELLMSALPPNSSFNISEISLATQIVRPHLNPNAAIKEVLYRSTMKIASEDRSDVLVANACYFGFPLLDPIGRILVAGMILKNRIEIMISSLRELVDMGGIEPDVIDFRSIRGRTHIEEEIQKEIKKECKSVKEALVNLDTNDIK